MVRFRLVPRDEGFFPLFDAAAENVAECARRLRSAIGDLTDLDNKRRLVAECEKRGDEITRTILRRLNSSFVTPFDREDIHALTEMIDDVVDDMQAASDLLVLHDVSSPLPDIGEMGDILVSAAEAAVSLTSKLSHLHDLETDHDAIDELESAADHVYRGCVARLFSGDYDAFEVLKWKDVVESIEASVNSIEQISDIVESIALKHA